MQRFRASITFTFKDARRSVGDADKLKRAIGGVGDEAVRTQRDKITPSLSRVRNDLVATTRLAGKFGAGMLIGAGLAGFAMISAARDASRFNQQLAAVGVISSASAKELKLLERSAIDAGLATQFSPQDAIMGLREMAQQGLNVRQQTAALLPVLDLATASLGTLGVAEGAFLASQSMKAFGVTEQGVTLAMDKLFMATNRFALKIEELPLGLGIVARGAQTMNQSLDESLIAFGLVKNIIPTVERAASTTAVAMERLVDPKRAKRLEKTFGVAVTDTEGKFRSFLDIMAEVAAASQDMTESQRSASLQKIFGARAAGGLNAILTQLNAGIKTTTGDTLKGAAAITYYRDQMKGAGGALEEFKDKMLDTFEGQNSLMKGVVETARVVIGKDFAAAFKPVVKFMVGFGTKFIKFWEKIPKGVRTFISAMVLATSVIAALSGGLLLTIAGVTGLVFVGGALVVALKAVALAMTAIVIVGAPLIALAGAVGLAWKTNLGGFADWVNKVRVGIEGVIAIVQGYKEGITEMSQETADGLKKAGIFDFVVMVGGNIGRLVEYIDNAFGVLGDNSDGIVAALEPIADAVLIVFSAIGRHISRVFGDDLPSDLDGTVKSTDSFRDRVEAMIPKIELWANRVKVGAQWVADAMDTVGPIMLRASKFMWRVILAGYELWSTYTRLKAAFVETEAIQSVVELSKELWRVFRDLYEMQKAVTDEAWLMVASLFGLESSVKGPTEDFDVLGAVLTFIKVQFDQAVFAIRLFTNGMLLMGLGVRSLLRNVQISFIYIKRAVMESMDVAEAAIDRMIKKLKGAGKVARGDLAGGWQMMADADAEYDKVESGAMERINAPLPEHLTRTMESPRLFNMQQLSSDERLAKPGAIDTGDETHRYLSRMIDEQVRANDLLATQQQERNISLPEDGANQSTYGQYAQDY